MSQDNNNAGKVFIEQVKATGTTDGSAAAAAVIIDNTAYGINKELQQQGGNDHPDCGHEKCMEHLPVMRKLCLGNQWPIHHPVLICTPDGVCCLCYCYE